MAGPLQMDPTRTVTLRRQAEKEVRRRVALIKAGWGPILDSLYASNALDAVSRLANFIGSIEGLIDTAMGFSSGAGWVTEITGQAYEKGITRAYADVGPPKGSTYPVGSLREFVGYMMAHKVPSSPIVLNAARRTKPFRGAGGRFVSEQVHLLALEFETTLKGATAAFAQKAARAVARAIREGWSKKALAQELEKELGITEARAKAIARTEIVKAHAEAQLDALAALGVEEIEAAVEWRTRVGACSLCQPLAGIVLTVDEARGLIPRHPNCYCAWKPVTRVKAGLKITRTQVSRAVRTSRERADDDFRVDVSGPRPLANVLMDLFRDLR